MWRLEGSAARVTAAQLQHRVPCWGYVFDELPEAAAAVAAAAAAAGDGSAAATEQAGEAGSSRQRVKGLLGRGKAVAAAAGAAGAAAGAVKASSGNKQRGRRVVILGDTIDSRAIGPIAHGADLLSHEATFSQVG